MKNKISPPEQESAAVARARPATEAYHEAWLLARAKIQKQRLIEEFPDASKTNRLLGEAPDMTIKEAAVYIAGYVAGYAEATGNESIA